MIAALVAAAAVVLADLAGWHGVDTAAQVYRVDSFRRIGFSWWDPGWYGGHWTADYSILYPPVAATAGMLVTAVVSAAVAAFAFDRLVRAHFGPGRPATIAALTFAAGATVPAAIGQYTFLAGEALALVALLAASRGRRGVAITAALLSALTAPLAAAFLALAAAAWAADRWLGEVRMRRRWGSERWATERPDTSRASPPGAGRDITTALAVAAAAAIPVIGGTLVFPGDGPMPYPVIDWLWELVIAAAIAALAGRRHRVIAIGAGMWAVAATVAVAVPSPLGGNVGRLEDAVALPIGVALAWERLPMLVVAVAVPLALSQWGPAWGALTEAPASASTRASFYAPLDAELRALSAGGPAGRVEVVPTRYHWEAVYVPAALPLARGWERQLDEADAALFYRPGALTAGSYLDWLIDNGVRFVALPAAPLDSAGRREAAMVAAGVPGLTPVWSSAGWRVFSVDASPGIVSGPARLVSAAGSEAELEVSGAGRLTVRFRWSPDWRIVDGAGCIARDHEWLTVDAARTGPLRLALSPLDPDRTPCPT